MKWIWLLALGACHPGTAPIATAPTGNAIEEDAITPVCTFSEDTNMGLQLELDTQLSDQEAPALGTLYIARCTVMGDSTPPGVIELQLQFSIVVSAKTDLATAQAGVKQAVLRLDFPDRQSVFFEVDITSQLQLTSLTAGVMKASATFNIDHVTALVQSTDPSCTTDGVQGTCDQDMPEPHAVTFGTIFPTD